MYKQLQQNIGGSHTVEVDSERVKVNKLKCFITAHLRDCVTIPCV